MVITLHLRSGNKISLEAPEETEEIKNKLDKLKEGD